MPGKAVPACRSRRPARRRRAPSPGRVRGPRRPGRRPRSRRPRAAWRWSPTPARCGRPPRPTAGRASSSPTAPGRPGDDHPGRGQALQVGDTGRRRQLGAVARRAAQRPWRASPPACAPLLLDHLQRLDGGGRVRGRDHPAGLGADHHGRDVVGHRVVQFPGESLALAERTCSSCRSRARPEPHGRPDHRGQEQEREARDLFDGRGVVRDDQQRGGREDHQARARSPVPIPTAAAQYTSTRTTLVYRPTGSGGVADQRGHLGSDHRAERRPRPSPAGGSGATAARAARRRTPRPPAATRRPPAAWPPAPPRPRPAASSAQSRHTRPGARAAVVRSTGFAGRLAARSQPRDRSARASAERTGRRSVRRTGGRGLRADVRAAPPRRSASRRPPCRRPTRWLEDPCSRKPSPAWAAAPPAIRGG